MNIIKNIAAGAAGLCLALALSACGNQDNRTPTTMLDEASDSLAASEMQGQKLRQDNAQVERNFVAYTYLVETEAGAKKLKTNLRPPERLETPEIEVESNQPGAFPEIEVNLEAATDDLRTDRPPLYGPSCLAAAYPVKCSNEKIRAYLEANLDFPESAIEEDHNGWELVSFRISKAGEMEPGVSILEHEYSCAGCAKAAAAIVEQMPEKWVPALQDGKPVSARVTLPVSFKNN